MKDFILNKMLFASWIVLVVIVLFSSLKEQIVIEKKIQKFISPIFPEGWAFFTKNPRDVTMEVYKINDSSINILPMSTHSKNSFFGLSRTPRIVGYEASIVSNEIPDSLWRKSVFTDLTKHIGNTPYISNKKDFFNYIKEGEYLFKVYRKVPFAWSKMNQTKNNQYRIAKVTIK